MCFYIFGCLIIFLREIQFVCRYFFLQKLLYAHFCNKGHFCICRSIWKISDEIFFGVDKSWQTCFALRDCVSDWNLFWMCIICMVVFMCKWWWTIEYSSKITAEVFLTERFVATTNRSISVFMWTTFRICLIMNYYVRDCFMIKGGVTSISWRKTVCKCVPVRKFTYECMSVWKRIYKGVCLLLLMLECVSVWDCVLLVFQEHKVSGCVFVRKYCGSCFYRHLLINFVTPVN